MPATDKPTDDVIEDDEAIDKWSKDFVREQARKMGAAMNNGPSVKYSEVADQIPSYEGT